MKKMKELEKSFEEYKKSSEAYLNDLKRHSFRLGALIWITILIWGVYWFFTKQYLFLFLGLCIATGQEVICQLMKRNGN